MTVGTTMFVVGALLVVLFVVTGYRIGRRDGRIDAECTSRGGQIVDGRCMRVTPLDGVP